MYMQDPLKHFNKELRTMDALRGTGKSRLFLTEKFKPLLNVEYKKLYPRLYVYESTTKY